MAWNLPESGKILKISEIVGETPDMIGRSVRVLAGVESYDFVKQQATVCNVERSIRCQLLVDTRLIDPFEARPGSLVQILGEIDKTASNRLILRARILKYVDGVDVSVYYRALEVQRQFFASRHDDWASTAP